MGKGFGSNFLLEKRKFRSSSSASAQGLKVSTFRGTKHIKGGWKFTSPRGRHKKGNFTQVMSLVSRGGRKGPESGTD